MLTLWELITKRRKKPGGMAPGSTALQSCVQPPARKKPTKKQTPMQLRYEAMTRELLTEHGLRVRKWRSSMSGVAWEVLYHNGRVTRLIESPKPKGPMSAAIFLHEVGHHAIGLGRYRPRCLEEYHAWRWSLEEMERRGLNITPNVHKRVRESLAYAVAKAKRRGLKRVPDELLPYLDGARGAVEDFAPSAD